MKIKLRSDLVIALLGFTLTPPLHAQFVPDGSTVNFTGTTNLGGSLTIGHNNGGTTLNILSPGAVTNGAAFVGFGISSDNNTVSVRGSGAVWDSGSVFLGYNGDNNSLIISNSGLAACSGDVTAGYFAYAVGNLVCVTDAGSRWEIANELTLGGSGNGNQLVISNGATIAATRSSLGKNSGNNVAIVTGSGSVWTNTQQLAIGFSSNRLIITNGGAFYSGGGNFTGELGTAEVTGQNSLWKNTGDLNLGIGGSANKLFIREGATVANASASVGFNSGNNLNSVVVAGSGSLWTNSIRLYVGNGGSQNDLIVSNGATVVNTDGYIGNSASSTDNQVIVTGSNSVWNSSGSLSVGESGSHNQLVISDGATVIDAYGYLGVNPSSSNNAAIVTGSGSLWTNRSSFWIGSSGNGNQLVIRDGAGVTAAANGTIGSFGTKDNTVRVTDPGSLLSVPGTLLVGLGNASGSELTVSNGATVVSAFAYIDCQNGSALVTGPGSLWTNSNTLDVGYSVNGNQLIVSDNAHVRSDILRLGDAGGADNLLRLENGILTTTSGLTIKANNTLTGNGTINGPVTIASGGNVAMEISKNGATLSNDQLLVNGVLTYGGTLTVSNLGPTTLAPGDSFPLFNATTYSGSFANYSLPALPLGLEWSTPPINGVLTVQLQTVVRFVNVRRVGSSVLFNLVGGPPNASYTLLWADRPDSPPDLWFYLLERTFSATGTDSVGLTIYPTVEDRYFRISVP